MTELVAPEPGRPADDDARQRALSSAAVRLWVLAAVAAGSATLVASMWLPAATAGSHGFALRVLLLAAGFAAAEMFPVHLEIRRHTWSTTLTAVPVVIGLVLSMPTVFLLSQVLGCFIAWGIVRRQALHKLALNVATAGLEATLAVVVYHAVAGTRAVVVPRAWMAILAAVAIEEAISSITVFVAMLSLTGEKPRGLVKNFLSGVLVSSSGSVLIICGLIVVQIQPYAAGLLLVVTGAFGLGYYELTVIRRRYASLQVLYGFTRAMQQSKQSSKLIEDLLRITRELLGADHAEIVLRDEHGQFLSQLLGPDGLSQRQTDLSPSWAAVEDCASGLLAPSGTRERRSRHWLNAQGWTDGMVAPLLRNGQTIGTIAVGNREGDVATFDKENLKLFEALAGHAAVSLENHTLIDQLEWEATHDTLTGLGNRREFYRNLAMALGERTPGRKLAVALIDLDRFKEINDTFGHHTGDVFLQWLGRQFKCGLPAGINATRLGGDEFAFYVSYEGTAQEAKGVIEEILRPLWSEAFTIGDVDVVVTASTGVSVAPDHAEDPVTLLQRADVAMYLAKEDHGGVTVYSTDRDTYSPRRVGLASALRTAIDHDELRLVFQPKLDLNTGHIEGAEALVRWQHPTEGLVLPDQFIAIAERTGLIVPLADVIIDKALAQCAEWQQGVPNVGIAVNLSVGNLTNENLVESIAEKLTRHQVAPQLLTLEVTETQIMEDERHNAAILESLAQLGVKISVDDFGTGYSSFAYLSRLPVHQLKIDKSFVGIMDLSPNDAAIVRSIIELGRTLGIEVVAEGVETRSKLETLVRLGCTLAQGYYIGAPMSSADFLTMASERTVERIPTPLFAPSTVRASLHAM